MHNSVGEKMGRCYSSGERKVNVPFFNGQKGKRGKRVFINNNSKKYLNKGIIPGPKAGSACIRKLTLRDWI